MAEQQQTLTIQQALDLALQHHTAGRLSDADTIYQQILQTDPDQPIALHLLGVIAHQVGKNDKAVDLITKALAIDPELAEAHCNLGLALEELGKPEEAISSYQKALALKPEYAEAHNNLGNALTVLGKLEEAVASYRKALAIKPDYVDAHNNLGNALQDLGKSDEAVASYRKALTIKPDYADAHYNLGNALRVLGRLDEAVTHCKKALSLKPDLAEAHSNLGNALRDLGKLEEAVASYRKALATKPDYVDAHSNLGNALTDLGKLDEAIASYHKALAIKPDYVDAHNNLGNALQDLGKLEEAIASYHKALAIKPDFAEAHNNLGGALRELGKLEEALTQHRRAISLDPQNNLFSNSFAACIETASFTSIDDNLYQDLLHLLERPTVRPANIARPIISALRLHLEFSAIVETTSSNQQDGKISYRDIAEQLSTIPLFLRILELSPVYDLEIERMLTVLRRAMLEETIEGKTEKKVFPFSTALAHNCFTNEYVFAETEEEKEAVEKLEQQVATLMEKDRPVPPSFVIALGAYRPLFQFSWAARLNERKWEDDIRSVIERQITEPLDEQSLRDQIRRITPVQNSVSQAVREQYEENPYPRWIKSDIYYKSGLIGNILRGPPLSFDLGDYTSPESPEILVAGCGTGQHALITASRFANAQVLAVDLSLNSLAYAERKTRELGFSNIEYVQGDLTELGQLERMFDLIECVGVLHHLGDPLTGWRVLVDLLRPGGLMRIGLYSEISHEDVIAVRSLIAEKGYTTSPEDIRRCRQELIGLAEDGNPTMAKTCNGIEFFNISNCRDLYFHVQVHRFTLPQVEEALKSLHLKFLGFEMEDRRPLRMFRESYPDSHDATSLSLWHEFELKNPDTFGKMYQFWCKKL